MAKNEEIIVFGGGCFWCTEAVFKMLKGVISVEPGYSGGVTLRDASGQEKNPTYEEVSMGNTGYVEVIKIEYDPKAISFKDLLTVFFAVHDPTMPMTKSSSTLDKIGAKNRSRLQSPDKVVDSRTNRSNRGSSIKSGQGQDVGEQYKSIILYTTEEQKKSSEKFVKNLNDSNENGSPIVTEVKKLDKFYLAEDYHKNYYENHKNQTYCQVVINPKLRKVQEKFTELLKSDANYK